MTGRPSGYTPEIADAICERIASGESLLSICRDEAMPSKFAVLKWLGKHDDFATQYARARELGMEARAHEIEEIAETPVIGVVRTIKPDGSVEEKQADMIEHRKLQIDTKKWLLSKLAPKKYGDKLQLAGDGGGPLRVVASSKDENL
jgi:hypothetical protein